MHSIMKQMRKELPEITFYAQWLVEKISDNIESLIATKLSVRGIEVP